jgi:hypothetical protein
MIFFAFSSVTLWEIVEEYLVEDEMIQEYIDQVEYSGNSNLQIEICIIFLEIKKCGVF